MVRVLSPWDSTAADLKVKVECDCLCEGNKDPCQGSIDTAPVGDMAPGAEHLPVAGTALRIPWSLDAQGLGLWVWFLDDSYSPWFSNKGDQERHCPPDSSPSLCAWA